MNRRSFLKANASVVTGIALANIITGKAKAADNKPVRIGVNTHGADWTLRNLKVSADTEPLSGEP